MFPCLETSFIVFVYWHFIRPLDSWNIPTQTQFTWISRQDTPLTGSCYNSIATDYTTCTYHSCNRYRFIQWNIQYIGIILFYIYRAVGYSYAYPQFLERYKLPSDVANEALIEYGIRQLTRHLESIEKGYLSKRRFLTGDRLTVADSYVATILLQAEWVGFKFTLWPKVEAWLKTVRCQDFWSEVHASHIKFLEELENAQYMDDWWMIPNSFI